MYNRDSCENCEGGRLINQYSYKPDPIFYGDNQELEEPFKKILEGIEEVRKIQDKYWSH